MHVFSVCNGDGCPDAPIEDDGEIVKHLKEQLANMKKELTNEKRKGRKRVNTSKVTIRSKAKLIADIGNFLSGNALKFVAAQIRLSGTRRLGYRWTKEEKSFALQMYHASPKCYRLLRKVFALPSLTTLRRLLRDLNMQPGFNQGVLDALKLKVSRMDDNSRICTILFDEISIKENVSYNQILDHIDGLEDFGNGQRTLKIANHAGVFMVSGIADNWKQPVGYVLSSGPVSGKRLKTLLLNCIEKVAETGLKVRVFVCDQGSNNRQMVNELGVTTDRPYFFNHDGEKVYVLYDPPHLIKNIRNNMKKHGFELNGKMIKWQYVEDLFGFDSARSIRMVPKLTRKHVRVPPFKTMSVKLATQVLSRTVAAAIDTLWELGKWSNDNNAKVTSEFINNMNTLFDVFNSSTTRKKGPLLRRGISEKSDHFEFLDSTIDWLKNLNVPGKSNQKQLPSVVGWQLNINSIKQLWQELHSNFKLDYLLTRRLNQDKLENFFSQIRFRGGHADNPTTVQFNAAYRQITVSQILAPVDNKNCEDDMDHFLICAAENLGPKSDKQNSDKQNSNTSPPSNNPSDGTEIPVLPSDTGELLDQCAPPSQSNSLDCQDSNVITYITGYLIRKSEKKFTICPTCCSSWKTTPESATSLNYQFIYKKQFEHLSHDKGLQLPSKSMIAMVSDLELSFRNRTAHLQGEKVFQRLLQALLAKVDFSEMTCELSNCKLAVEYMVALFCRVRLHHFLKEQNRLILAPKQKRNRKIMKLSHY